MTLKRGMPVTLKHWNTTGVVTAITDDKIEMYHNGCISIIPKKECFPSPQREDSVILSEIHNLWEWWQDGSWFPNGACRFIRFSRTLSALYTEYGRWLTKEEATLQTALKNPTNTFLPGDPVRLTEGTYMGVVVRTDEWRTYVYKDDEIIKVCCSSLVKSSPRLPMAIILDLGHIQRMEFLGKIDTFTSLEIQSALKREIRS